MEVRTPYPASESLRIGSTHEEARRARSWLASRLQAAGCPPDFSGEVLLAVGEALTNIVRHAYAGQPGHLIDLRLHCREAGVEVVLQDEAPCYDDARKGTLPDPASLAEGGYGLFLMTTIMDEIHRSRRGPVGNTLRLLKYWPREERKAS